MNPPPAGTTSRVSIASAPRLALNVRNGGQYSDPAVAFTEAPSSLAGHAGSLNAPPNPMATAQSPPWSLWP